MRHTRTVGLCPHLTQPTCPSVGMSTQEQQEHRGGEFSGEGHTPPFFVHILLVAIYSSLYGILEPVFTAWAADSYSTGPHSSQH